VNGDLLVIPGYEVAIRDTSGAGDIFHGAYALAVAEGRTVPEAARFANAAAAIKCTLGNGWQGMPTRQAVENLTRGLMK
jgi:sulfofructose kinase